MTVDEYIEAYTRNCSNELDGFKEKTFHPWLTPDNARAVAEIAREEVIEKAVEWLANWDKYMVCLEGHKDWFIEQFEKALKE